MKGKKGFSQLGLLSSAAIIFVVAAIVTSFGAKVTSEIQGEMTPNSVANATAGNATAAIGKLAKYMPLLGLVVAAAIIISVVVGSFKQ